MMSKVLDYWYTPLGPPPPHHHHASSTEVYCLFAASPLDVHDEATGETRLFYSVNFMFLVCPITDTSGLHTDCSQGARGPGYMDTLLSKTMLSMFGVSRATKRNSSLRNLVKPPNGDHLSAIFAIQVSN